MRNFILSLLILFMLPSFLFSTVLPNGGENGDFWRQSTTRTIQWDTSQFHGYVNVYIWQKSSATFHLVDTNISASSGTYSFNIPSDFPTGDDFRIKLLQMDSTNYYQFSETFFPIYPPSSPIHVGVNDSKTDNTYFRVNPNPATDFLELSFTAEPSQSKIEIFSIEGIKMFETEPVNRIDVSRLSSGVYFVRYGSRVCKFVKL